MALKTKNNPRDLNLITNHDGVVFDLSRYNVLHSGIDTVRQLYSGLLIPEIYQEIEKAYTDGFGLAVKLFSFDFIVSSGGKSGYRYILKNENIGLVLMVGSSYVEPKYNGHHLKIQTSPIFTLSRTLEDVQETLDDFAEFLMTQVLHTGIALHICADVQGWIPPADLDSRLTTKARRVTRHSGASQVNYEYSNVAVVYGRSQSFTFGNAGSLQFNVYNKWQAAKDKDELEIWLPVWSQNENYNPDDLVFRFEVRFHQNIINQFANGSGFQANKLLDLKEHLTGLWQFSMDNFRLDDTKTYINPFWQWLRDDMVFFDSPKLEIDYKRMYKSPLEVGRPSARSIAICFGQLCSIYGRNGYTLNKAVQHLQNSGIWENLAEMYTDRGGSVDDIYIAIEDKLSRFKKAA